LNASRYQNEVTLRAKANKAGVVTIALAVTTPCNVLGGCRIQPSFSSSVKIEIFEELQLTNDGATSESLVLIMAPNSSMKLQTNRDKFGLTTYKIINRQIGGDVDDPNVLASLSNVITIDKTGLLKSGEHYGSGIVLITNIEAYSIKQTLTITIYVIFVITYFLFIN
jgi:hypothetical protein